MLCDDINDDGRTHDRGDGVEGNDARLARQEADGIAQEGNDGAAEYSTRHEDTVVGLTVEQVGYVWNGQTDEHNGAAVGGSHGSQQACDNEQIVADATGVDT